MWREIPVPKHVPLTFAHTNCSDIHRGYASPQAGINSKAVPSPHSSSASTDTCSRKTLQVNKALKKPQQKIKETLWRTTKACSLKSKLLEVAHTLLPPSVPGGIFREKG